MMSSSSWTLCASARPRTVYTRPLGTSELGFYWDGEFAGTGDTLQHVLAELRSTENRTLLTGENFARAWVELKKRFPILASSIEVGSGEENAKFLIDTEIVHRVRSGELTVKEVSSAQEVEEFNDTLITGPRQLSSQVPARMWILLRRDSWKHFHVLIHVAHVITDGLSNAVILREFFNLLCGASVGISSGIEDRLGLSLSMEALHPHPKMNISRKRWRFAIAAVMLTSRSEKLKGGHTIPRTVTPNSIYTPAQSRSELFAFPPSTSTRILANCRKSHITFGHAFPVLAQIAQARILHRQRRQNKISDREWKYRLCQPMHFEGPRSLRSYIDPEWYSSGGVDGVGVYCSNFTNTLPFMPSYRMANGTDGRNPYYKLLTRERFLHRSNKLKKEMTESGAHPLLYELSLLFHKRKSLESKEAALTWQALKNVEWVPHGIGQTPPVAEYPGNGNTVFANGGSSMGNLDLMFPADYPRPLEGRENVEPMVRATLSTNRLRCRPKELYLGAYMTSHKIHLFVFWDGNVYDHDVVQEWLEEVKLATVHYLAETEFSTAKYDNGSIMSRL